MTKSHKLRQFSGSTLYSPIPDVHNWNWAKRNNAMQASVDNNITAELASASTPEHSEGMLCAAGKMYIYDVELVRDMYISVRFHFKLKYFIIQINYTD